MRVEYLLRASARRVGQKLAIAAGRGVHSFTKLDRQSDLLAAAIVGQGVRPDDRIAVFLDDGFPAVVAIFAILKAGAVVAPVNPATPPEELAAWLTNQNAVGLITEARLAARAGEALRGIRSVRSVVLVGGDRTSASASCLSFEEIVGRFGVATAISAGADDAVAAVFPESDTGAETVSHADLIAASALDAPAEEATIVADYPLSSRAGLQRLIAAIAGGAGLVLDGRPAGRTQRGSHPLRSFPLGSSFRLALAG